MDDSNCGRKNQSNVRRLRFEENCHLRLVEKITNSKEVTAMWYGPDDALRFRRELEEEDIINDKCDYSNQLQDHQYSSHVRNPQRSSCHGGDGIAPCDYYVYHPSRQEQRRRMRQRQQSQNVVFREQDLQLGNGRTDPEQIARCYQRASKGAQLEAFERARLICFQPESHCDQSYSQNFEAELVKQYQQQCTAKPQMLTAAKTESHANISGEDDDDITCPISTSNP
jgi:hypothetical protein